MVIRDQVSYAMGHSWVGLTVTVAIAPRRSYNDGMSNGNDDNSDCDLAAMVDVHDIIHQ